MNSNGTNGTLVSTQGLPMGMASPEMMRRLCDVTGVDFARIERCLMEYEARCASYQTECATLRQQCCDLDRKYKTLEDLLRRANCPEQVLYSEPTLADYSDDNQVEVATIVTGLGGDYVDSMPLPPGKTIRLIQQTRPGYRPTHLAIDASLANNGTNYLDLMIQFYLVPGGSQPQGKPYGPRFRGNQFLNKDGSQIHVPFPTYTNKKITVGALDRLAVEIQHVGPANNLTSVFVTARHDAACAYEACKTA